MLSKQGALGGLPLVRPDSRGMAALDSDGMDIDVDALEQGFLRGGRAAGAILITKSWITKAQRRNARWSIESSGGSGSAPIVINAAGAWADEVGAICGARPIGLQLLLLTALLIAAPAGCDTR